MPVTVTNLRDAAEIHAVAWRESHRTICSEAFVAAHTTDRQMGYIAKAISDGKRFYLLADEVPVAIASVAGNIIADLYVHPDRQHRGYGTKLLRFAMGVCDGPPTLWVLNTNEYARRFYERSGFLTTGQKKMLSDKLFEIEMRYAKGGFQ